MFHIFRILTIYDRTSQNNYAGQNSVLTRISNWRRNGRKPQCWFRCILFSYRHWSGCPLMVRDQYEWQKSRFQVFCYVFCFRNLFWKGSLLLIPTLANTSKIFNFPYYFPYLWTFTFRISFLIHRFSSYIYLFLSKEVHPDNKIIISRSSRYLS